MTGPRSFGPDELDGVAGLTPDELRAETRLARDLEGIAARDGIRPSPDFADRVMGAISTEPLPAPAIAAGSALRHAALPGFLASLRDAFRVTFSGGFPVAARAQAFALVLLVVGLTAGSGYAAAGAAGAFADRGGHDPTTEVPTTAQAATATPGATTSVTSGPWANPAPSPAPALTADPSASPEPTADGGEGDGASRTQPAGPNATAKSTRAPSAKPTATHTPKPTLKPTTSPSGGEEATEAPEAPEATRTPRPTASPSPSPTKHD